MSQIHIEFVTSMSRLSNFFAPVTFFVANSPLNARLKGVNLDGSANKKMATKHPLSVFIIAMNEADRIERAIQSVIDWVDEVLVIDSGSIDDTIELSRHLGARTLFNKWEGFGQQKIFGEHACQNDWILNIDADEQISPELKEEIIEVFQKGPPKVAAFKMHWKMVLFHEKHPRRFAARRNFIRLYDRSRCGFRNSAVHDSVVVRDGELGELNGLVYHFTFRSADHMRTKLDAYGSMLAEDLYSKGRRPSRVRVMAEPAFAFMKCFFGRRYCLYGVAGVQISLIFAQYRKARLEKARQLFEAGVPRQNHTAAE